VSKARLVITATAYTARPKATPGADRSADTHDRVRTDKIDKTGCVTLRLGGRLHHIGIGRTHTGTHVLLLVQDLHVRVIGAATGELLRELTIAPPATTSPPDDHPDPPTHERRPDPQSVGPGVRMSCDITRAEGVGFEPTMGLTP
jgi:hypothetical protein